MSKRWRAPRTQAGAGARARSGFTLIEVAIALAIIGIGVVAVLELFSAGLRMETGSGTRARALVYARGVLDQMMTLDEVKAGNAQGQLENGYRWESKVREAPEYTDDEDRELEVKNDVTLYEIEVSVLWPQTAAREGVYTIRTLRVAPRPPR